MSSYEAIAMEVDVGSRGTFLIVGSNRDQFDITNGLPNGDVNRLIRCLEDDSTRNAIERALGPEAG